MKRKRRIRSALFKSQNGLCAQCGNTMLMRERCPIDRNEPRDATIDHYIPRSKDGSNAITNLRLVCFDCNWRKADKCGPELNQFYSDITNASCTQ